MTRTALTADEVRSLLSVSRETLDRLALHLALVEKWTRAINLVSPRTLEDPWRRHVLDSAQLLALLPPERPRRLLDLGSGAGFPGLVLAILGAGDVHLVESDQRKAQFLREASRATGAGVQVHHARIEDLSPLSADVVTARALAPLDRLLDHVARHLEPHGVALLPKGRGVEAELAEARRRWRFSEARQTSASDPEGVILRLSELSAIEAGGERSP